MHEPALERENVFLQRGRHVRLILPRQGRRTWIEGKGQQSEENADGAKSKTD